MHTTDSPHDTPATRSREILQDIATFLREDAFFLDESDGGGAPDVGKNLAVDLAKGRYGFVVDSLHGEAHVLARAAEWGPDNDHYDRAHRVLLFVADLVEHVTGDYLSGRGA